MPATPAELKDLKALGAIEKGSRKANLLTLDVTVCLLRQTKKDIDVFAFQELVRRHNSCGQSSLARTPLVAVPTTKALQAPSPQIPTLSAATSTTKNQPAMTAPCLPASIQTADDGSISAKNSHPAAGDVYKPLPLPFLNDPPSSTPLRNISHVAPLKDLPPVVPIPSKDALHKTGPPNKAPLCGLRSQPAAALCETEMLPTIPKKKAPPRAKKYTLSEDDFNQTLKVQLADLQNFWMQPSSTKRQAKAVNLTTHLKRRERLLCYLGWAKEHGCVDQPNLTHFDIEQDESNRTRFEQYLTYLKEERQLSNGTIVEMITAAIYVLKFLYASDAASNFAKTPAIRQLKTLRNSYQREYEKSLKKDWVELREEDKFLHYEEIQQVLKTLLHDFLGDQTDPNKVEEVTHTSEMVKKAKQLQKFLILLFYTSLPPSRGLEIRSLQFGSSLQWRKTSNSWWIVLERYKTSSTKGSDSLELEPQSQKLLVAYLELFGNSYRSHLFQKWQDKHNRKQLDSQELQDQEYLFVPSTKSKQQCFSESGWSQLVCTIFKEKTGMAISINSLRSSFVTYFYSSDASDSLGLRESIASGMRHSIAEAKKTYDRRTDFEKKRKAVEYCGNNTMQSLKGENEQILLPPEPKVMKMGPAGKTYDDNTPHTHPLHIGDVVAVPHVGDDEKPNFWLGKCLRIETESTVMLGWLKPTDQDPSRYKLVIGSSWEENSNACIFPIDVQYSTTDRAYTLHTDREDILLALDAKLK